MFSSYNRRLYNSGHKNEKKIMDIIYTATMIGVGVAIGMYIASQISQGIDSNINHKKFMKNMEEYDKKKDETR